MSIAQPTPRTAPPPIGDMPRFIEREDAQPEDKFRAVRRTIARGSIQEDTEVHVPLKVYLTDYLWPVMFWCMLCYNGAVMALAALDISKNGYNSLTHLQGGFITVVTTACAAMIVKWILNGPDGLPGRRSQTHPDNDIE